jgi:HD-GYP domain-containing protein (c-di-GMP phosphodiesterase class II)
MLGLANIKNYDEYTFNHSVNVAIYAIALGQRVGFPKSTFPIWHGQSLSRHRQNKNSLEILNKPEKLTPEDWAVIQRHPVFGQKQSCASSNGELSARMIQGSLTTT